MLHFCTGPHTHFINTARSQLSMTRSRVHLLGGLGTFEQGVNEKCSWRAGGRVEVESACKFAGYICMLSLGCVRLSVCLCVSVWVGRVYLYLLFIQKLCASLAHATVYSGLVLKQTQKAAKHSQAVACQAASLRPSSSPSQFVCLRLVVCNAFATVLTASADCTANLPHYPHACNNLQLSSVCRRYTSNPLPPKLTHMFTLEEENFFSNF